MRALSPRLIEAVRSRTVCPVLLFELAHPSGPLRLWTGLGTLQWDGKAWVGAGNLVKCTPVEETTEIQVARATFVMAAPELSAEAYAAIATPVTRLPARSWKAFLDADGAVIDAVLRWRGYADAPVINDDESGQRTVSITVDGAVYNLTKPIGTVLSDEEQQARYPGDTGLSDMKNIADQQLVWTTGAYNNFSPPA